MPTIMHTVMLLAPWLATQTYACPWAIVPVAVASVNMRSGVRLNVQSTARTLTEAPAKLPVDTQTADFLLFKDDTWRSAQTLTDDDFDAEISDARLRCARPPSH